MKTVFISSTLKSEWNLAFNKRLCSCLEQKGLACFLPQRDVLSGSVQAIFEQNIRAINQADVVVVIAVNESPSLGLEAGYAYGIRKRMLMLTFKDHALPEMFAGMDVEILRVTDLDRIDEYLDALLEKIKGFHF
jgi:nucleoside 2-deoxyribosyltransferase